MPLATPLLTCVLGMAIGFGIRPHLSIHQGSYTLEDDVNGDGKPDICYFYERDVLARMETDRNFDEKVDEWAHYKGGLLSEGVADENFDGAPDAWFNYKGGNVAESTQDTDRNGVPDIWVDYQFGVIKGCAVRPNKSLNATQLSLYRNGVVYKSYISTNADGSFQIEVSYDSFEMETGRRVLDRPLKAVEIH